MTCEIVSNGFAPFNGARPVSNSFSVGTFGAAQVNAEGLNLVQVAGDKLILAAQASLNVATGNLAISRWPILSRRRCWGARKSRLDS